MAQEESILGCSYSGGAGGTAPGGGRGGGSGRGGGCSRSKKIKQKKVPQRGLGVAQLEKIRMEEQQKKESLQAANILAKNAAVGSASDSSPFLAVQKFRSNLSHFHNSVPNLEIMHDNSKQSSGEIDSKAILSPRLWGGEYSLARLDQHGFAFDPNLNLSYENTPVLPRSNQFHQPSSSSSMLQMNSSSGIQPLSSSQTEPPSNQSFRSSNYAPLWTEEEKMVGMKRSYPFSLDSPPAPSFSFHPIYAASSKSDELALCSNGYSDRMDPKRICIRDGPSNSSPLPEKKPNEDDGRLNGDFLTLAPPLVASPPLIAKHKVFPGYSGYHGQEYECRTSQDYGKSQPGSSGSVELPFSFFPTKLQSYQTSTDASNENGDKGETIDLNLKL